MGPIAQLVEYLLDNRYRLTGDTIADCLDLFRLLGGRPGRRVRAEVLMEHWHCSRMNVVKKMQRLERAGLIDYEAGNRSEPGYLFFRIGPA